MAEGLAPELLCSVCGEVCKRGAQMKCCGARACRACAVLKINKNKKCWNHDCGQEDITVASDLVNDDLLRMAVEYFNNNGEMDPGHEKALKKTKDGKGLEKIEENNNGEMNPSHEKPLKKTKDGKGIDKIKEKVPLDVTEKFNKPCRFGEKCERKGCLFVHDKRKTAELKGKDNVKSCRKGGKCTNEKCKFRHPSVPKPVLEKKAKAAAKGNGKPCMFGILCIKKDVCKFNHPKRCRFGAGCTTEDCKFDHGPSNKVQKLRNLHTSRRRVSSGMDRMKEDTGRMRRGIERNTKLDKMQKMKEELENMMSNVMGRASDGGMGGSGMGGGYGGWSSDWMPSIRPTPSMKMGMNDMVMDGDWDDMGGRNTNLAQMQKMKEELECAMAKVMGRMGGSGMGGGYDGRSSDRMGGGMGGMRRGRDGGMGSMKMRLGDMVIDEGWDDMGGRNTSMAQMHKMKEELETMMSNVMGRVSGGGMGRSGMEGGYGGRSMERSSDRTGGSRISGGYGGSSRRFDF